MSTLGFDPQDNQLAGPALLLEGGLYNILANQVEERMSSPLCHHLSHSY